jgi:hypothetical protein
MFRKIFLPILGIVGSLVFLFFSITILPLLMGGLATICIIGCVLGVIGSGFVLVMHCINRNPVWYNPVKWSVCGLGLGLFLAAFLIWGCLQLSNYCASKLSNPITNVDNKTATKADSNTPATENATTDPKTSAGIAPVINEGANFGTNEKVLVQAGDVVSGDIQIINSDGTRESLYDDHSDTALITIFTQDTWIIGPFGEGVGGYRAKQATQAETDKMIADKQQSPDNFREVIVKTWPSGKVVSYPGNNIK